MFVDLKVAFDSVDRGKLIEAMEKRGIRKSLTRRTKEIMRETSCRVRAGGKIGEKFWTERGVKQGCPLSPLLYNVLTAEEEMAKVKWGGVKIGEKKIYTLAYADDMVLMAHEEEEMESMIVRLEEYLDKKKLELNASKTKMMRFRKGGGTVKKRGWRWKRKKIEEVKEFTYLGYRLQRNGKQEGYVRERIGRAAAIMGQVWGMGKRRFGKDWGKRV